MAKLSLHIKEEEKHLADKYKPGKIFHQIAYDVNTNKAVVNV